MLIEGVEQRLVCVSVVRKDVEAHRCFPAVGAVAGRHIDTRYTQQSLHDEVRQPISVLVGGPHLQIAEHTAADNDVGFLVEDRRDQVWDAALVVVVVGVRVDDDVGAKRDRLIESAAEGSGKTSARQRLSLLCA